MCTVTSKVVTMGSLWQPHPEVDKQKVEPGMAWYGMVWHGLETICKVVRLANALGIHDSSLPLAILFRSGSSSQVRNRLLLVDIQSESQRAQHEPA